MSQKGFAPILIVFAAVALMGLIGGAFFLGRQSSKPISQSQTPQPVATVPLDRTADWQTYNDGVYSFKHPRDWIAEGKYDDYYQGQVVSMHNPTKQVAVHIYPKQPVYGCEGPENNCPTQSTPLTISVGDNSYIAQENTLNDRKAFVDLKISREKEYHILFGTGYPAGDDQLASLSEYVKAKETILQILSTFRFTDQSDATNGWKTFTSTQHGFTIQYPPDVQIYEKTSENAVDFILDGPTQRQQSENSDGLALRFTSGSLGGKTLEDFVLERSNNGAEILLPVKPTTTAGISGYTYRALGLGASTYIYVLKGQREYVEIIDYTIDPTGKGFERIVDQILSTFKFTQ